MKTTIADRYMALHAKRSEVLDRARLCAAMSHPWVLPPDGHSSGDRLPENYQSIVSRGIGNVAGRVLGAMYDPSRPWFRMLPSTAVQSELRDDPERLSEIQRRLFAYELTIQAALESPPKNSNGRGPRSYGGSFLSQKRQSIIQSLITGDTLEQLTDDYRLKVIRRDKYVTMRDSSCDPFLHIIQESVDPLTLSDDQLAKTELDIKKLKKKPSDERAETMHTSVEWQPYSRKWVITQEVNEKKINVSEDTVSPFFCASLELVAGEDYGRGLVEINLGNVRSLDTLMLRMLEGAAYSAKVLWAIDHGSETTEDDMLRDSGSVIRARVGGGQIQDIAALSANKGFDFRVVFEMIRFLEEQLGKAFLLESETAPTGEAGRSPVSWQRIATELQGSLGGLYAPLADRSQGPLLDRMIYQLTRDKILPKLDPGLIQYRVVTGLYALSREAKMQAYMGVVNTVAGLAQYYPEVARRLNPDAVIDAAVRYANIDDTTLTKTPDQVRRDVEEAQQAQTQAAAADKTIDVLGNVAEAQLTQQQQR